MLRHFYTLILIGLLCLTGCGGGGSSSKSTTEAPAAETTSKVAITGTLSGGGFVHYNWLDRFLNRVTTPAYAAGGKPNKIIAVSKSGEILENFDIGDDGTFEVDIEELKDENFTLFVKNTITNEISGHIRLRNRRHSCTLDVLDGSTFESGLQLGIMDVDELTGPEIEETDAFNITDKEFLVELAINDDAIVSHRNKLCNSGIESYLAIVFNLGEPTDIMDNYFDIANFSKSNNFRGKMPLFYYYGDEAETLTNISLFPPENILHSDPNNTQSDFDCDIFADETDGIEKNVNYCPCGLVTIETAYVDSLPEGEWILKNINADTTLGSFIFSDAEPFDDNNTFKSFIPVPRINTENGYMISVSLNLDRYNDSDLEEINKHFFEAIAEDLQISYVLNDNSPSKNLEMLNADDEETEFTFVSQEPVNIDDLDRLIISYKIGEAKYQFFIE